MQKYGLPVIVAISAVLVGSGIFTTTGLLGPQNQATTEGNNVGGSVGFSGHLILEAKDSQEHIKAYRQTDNLILDGGGNCIGKLVFGANGTNPLSGCLPYHVIAVGENTSTTAQLAGTDRDYYALLQEIAGTSRVDASGVNLGITNSTGTGVGKGAVASIGSTVIIGATGGTVATVGLLDTTTLNSGHVFARQAISPNIAVNPADTIKVTWYITIVH